ncbi:UvrD-helicase domain-containing protein [Dokdonia ponticola]|uniref:DNA 3'-5' helicase n=1 Tax=Dokdonia ponticola TaxID=2041041 RepID=A0ABV9HWV3_9FLAO
MSVIIINSDFKIADIENNFKVSAGPGAGKTHWLVNHIRNILHSSNKLSITRKVACITYTNTAVENIYKRLGTSSAQVEVSTIHSFLYKHVVKPYVSFIAEQYSLDISKIDGHDDIILSNYSFLNDWKARTRQQRIRDDSVVISAFKNLRWKIEGDDLVVKTPYPFKMGNYPIRNDSYLEYKTMTWEKGIIHHDDVLFFSYQIFKQIPFVAKILLAKFPYLVVDEFQDCNPIQITIFKALGLEGVITGVIGDPIQSIYGFQGADYSQFHSFTLPEIKEYYLNENRRSSNEIVGLLNSIRTGITQVPFRNTNTQNPKIIVGDMLFALRRAKMISGNEKVNTLSRVNITSNAMKAEISGTGLDSKLLGKLVESDKPSSSNKYRSKLITSCIKSIAFARENKFKDAIKELEKFFNYKADKIKGKRRALKYITILLKSFEEYKSSSLIEFSEFVRLNLEPSMTKVSRGAVKVFYENHTFNQLLLCVSIPEDLSLHKTIHKSKGDEFKNVLLVLEKEDDIDLFINPDLEQNEEHRVNYVAISRAENKLFISVPVLSKNNQEMLNTLFDIEIL